MAFANEKQAINFIQINNLTLFFLINVTNAFFSNDPISKKDVYDIWLARKGIVLEVQKRFKEIIFTRNTRQIDDLLHSLSAVRNRLSDIYFADSDGKDQSILKKHISYLRKREEQIKAELLKICDAFKGIKTILDVNTNTIAGLLPSDSALIDFAVMPGYDFEKHQWLPERYFAFTIPAGKLDEIELHDLGEAEEIDEIICWFKQNITMIDNKSKRGMAINIAISPKSIHKNAKSKENAIKLFSRKLAKRIFDPIITRFHNVKDIYISPDGQLNTVPFEVLTDNKGEYLIDSYTFNYVGTPREMTNYGQGASKNGKLMILGDPDFDIDLSTQERPDARGCRSFALGKDGFARLPGTRREVYDIFHFMGDENSVLYTGIDANETVLMNSVIPQMLHIATHGFFLETQNRYNSNSLKESEFQVRNFWQKRGLCIENPLIRSGIALAGANVSLKRSDKNCSEGIVTAEKILAIDLKNTEMVVLSACETGLGEVKNGEGFFGLRRAFMQAGAKSIIMSMWRIPDDETRDIMVSFYGNIIKNKMNRSKALRQAVLMTKSRIQKKYGHTHPLFWGGFVFLGDPGNFKIAVPKVSSGLTSQDL